MPPSGPGLAQMADALFELVELERKRLRDWDDLTYRQGLSPGNDVSFAGVRILVQRASALQQLVRRLVPHEEAFFAWLEQRPQTAPQLEPASPGQL